MRRRADPELPPVITALAWVAMVLSTLTVIAILGGVWYHLAH